MSSDDDLEIPDFDQDLSDSESEFMQKKNDGPAKNIPEKSNKNDSTTTETASTSSSKKPASKPTSNGKKVCKFCDQDLTRWKLSAEKFREHMDKCETKKHLHQYILKNNNAGVFQCQLCPKANVRYDTMLKHVEEKHKESIKVSQTLSRKVHFLNRIFKDNQYFTVFRALWKEFLWWSQYLECAAFVMMNLGRYILKNVEILNNFL